MRTARIRNRLRRVARGREPSAAPPEDSTDEIASPRPGNRPYARREG